MAYAPIIGLLAAVASAPAAWAQEAIGCFLAGRNAVIADGARITGDVGVNDAGGTLRLGQRVVVSGGTARAEVVILGDASVVPTVAAKHLVTRRAQVGAFVDVVLPLVPEFCVVPAAECGGADVVVLRGASGSVSPGAYDAVQLDDGATLQLGPGAYSFCRIRAARRAEIRVVGETSIDVRGGLRINDGGALGPLGEGPLPIVNLHGATARFGRHVEIAAHLVAPAAALRVRRGSSWRGSFCAERVHTERRVTLDCEALGPSPTTTTTTLSSTTSTSSSPTTTITTTTIVTITTTTTGETTTTSSTTSTTTVASTTTIAGATTTTSTVEPITSTTTTTPSTTISTTSTTSTTIVTTTTSTTTTTIPAQATCGPSGLDLTTALVYEPRLTGGIFGMFLLVNYPTSVSIPGSGTASTARARFTNLIGTAYRFIPSDVDTDANAVDDQGRTLITANSGSPEIPSAPIERVRFDCPGGTIVQTSQFGCVVDQPSDSSGQPFPPEVAAQFVCTLSFSPAQ